MFCPLPWTHVGVKNNGALRMCSHSQSLGTGNTVLIKDNKPLYIEDMSNIDVLNCDSLKPVRQQMLNNEWPEQCKRCKLENEAGHRSRNEWETVRHSESFTIEDARRITLPDGTITESHIQDLDLRVGNQCNLRCTMCFPGESTKWYKDYEFITQEQSFNVDGKVYPLIQSMGDFDWVRSEQKVNSLLDNSEHLLKIKFGGGEPLMIKHHKDLIEGLIDRGYAHKIELEYSSNLTVFPEELFTLWKQFKLIKICASLDATYQANEAIRYPTQWDIVENNLRMLDNTDDNIEVFTSTTISLLSLEHYVDTINWVNSQNYQKINRNSYSNGASHPVYNPKYLNIAILDSVNRDKIFNMLLDNIDSKTRSKVEFYLKYCNLMAVQDPEQYRKQFSERFYRFSTVQNQDWASIFPVASMLANDWKIYV